MYETYIPVISKEMPNKEKKSLAVQLKRANPDIVYLVYMRQIHTNIEKAINIFTDNKNYLEENGFEVGVWFAPTIGYGGYDVDDKNFYQRIVDLDGKKINAYCPLDDNFCDDLAKQFKLLAKTGVKHILLEDDFTLSGGKLWVERMGCACDLHMKKLSEILKRDISRGELLPYLISGERNEYRSAYLKLMGETLLKLAGVIERAVHSVDENIRIGFSSNSASYHIEGINSLEIAKAVAGKNKPYIRITAAPYWHNGPTLNSIIEAARVQNVWCEENGIDAITEGDTYPRPRYMVSSAYLEMYDMILRADGNSVGILKYMIDYNSNADFETGYIDRYVKNSDNYAEIEKRFSGMKSVGLELFEKPHSIAEMDFDEIFEMHEFTSHGTLPLLSQWFVSENSIPTTYEKSDGAMLVFGTNAQYLSEDDLKRGVIIDVEAAKILNSRGVDVGFESIEAAKKPDGEYFADEDDNTLASAGTEKGFYRFKLKKNAKVLSYFYNTECTLGVTESYNDRSDEYPSCYIYENEKNQRFMVYTFSPWQVKTQSEWHAGIFKNYYRQSQIIKGYEWLSGKPLPAVCPKNPGLYILCKKDKTRLTVGLWNIFADEILNPVITADDEYKSIDAYKCSGKIVKNKVRLDSGIAPYSFVCFTLEK